MPAEIPTGIPGPQGPPGPALTGGARRTYLNCATALPGYSTPDHASLHPAATDVLSLRALIYGPLAGGGWGGGPGNEFWVSKWESAGSGRAYKFGATNTGQYVFQYSIDGVNTTNTFTSGDVQAHLSAIDDLPYWVRCDYQDNNGTGHYQLKFYIGIIQKDGSIVWTQIGAGQTGTSFGAASTSAGHLYAGTDAATTPGPWVGRLYEAEVWIAGTLVAQFDARGAANPPATYTGVAGKVWTPQTNTQLLPDNVDGTDMRDETVWPSRIIATPDSSKTYLRSIGGVQDWASAGPFTASDVDVVDLMAAMLGMVNPCYPPYNAPFDQVNDDTPGLAAALAAMPNSAPNIGGTLYLPGRTPLHPSRACLLKTHLATNLNGISIVGAGAHGGPLGAGGPPGPSHVMVWEQMIRFNEGAASKFGGPILRDFAVTPAFTKISGAQVITNGGVITCSANWPISRLPASGTVIVYDQRAGPLTGVRGYYAYTGKSGNTLTGISVLFEELPGQSWADGKIVVLAGTAGIGPINFNQFQHVGLSISGFIDGRAANRRTAGFGIWNNGQGTSLGAADPNLVAPQNYGISQYGLMERCAVNECHTSVIEDSSSTRHLLGNYDGWGPYPGQRGILASDPRTMEITDTNADSHEIDIDAAGLQGGTSNHGFTIKTTRGERFSQRHIRFTDLRNPYFVGGGTVVDSLLSSMGTVLEILRVSGIHADFPSVNSVAALAIIDAASTGTFNIEGVGSPQGVHAAPVSSFYRQLDGVALADAGTGIWWMKKALGASPYNTGWAAVA